MPSEPVTTPERCPHCGHDKIIRWLSPFQLTAPHPQDIPPKVDRACDGGCNRFWLSNEGLRRG